MTDRLGRVAWGANNIYWVQALDHDQGYECRLKGKQLAIAGEYNVLVPGDLVTVMVSSKGSLITKRLPRQNVVIRWNKRSGRPQALAANLTQVFCVCAPDSPPFRPRFIDRCLVATEQAKLPAVVLVNKIDQPLSAQTEERLANYQALGYPVMRTSVTAGLGLAELAACLPSGISLFLGQSGVGKSSLINRLAPLAAAKTGQISQKFNRGRHVTVLSRLYVLDNRRSIIDSPGLREFEPVEHPQNLPFLFREIANLVNDCALYNCTHRFEPDCAVRKAAEQGQIHSDRYESYLRIWEALQAQKVYAS